MKKFLLTAIAVMISAAAFAQESSSSSVVRRRSADDRNASKSTSGVTQRMQSHFEDTPVSDSELQWMRVIYRELDLMKDSNSALYYPDEPIDGQENLFRIILGRMAANELGAYEYLDGREMFTDAYKVNMRDVLDRFHILYTDAKGSTERNPRFVIEEADVPASEILSYYVIERWEFDKRQNRMRTRIEAICPVLHRSGDFGGEAVKYPMFWVKYDDLRPYLTTQNIFINDDNNLASCTYDDFFQMGLYNGDIYKTRNMRNRSLMQMHQDPDELAHARDSIQKRLDSFEEKLWVPSLEELAARREAAEKADMASADTAAAENPTGESIDNASSTPTVRSARSKRGQTKLSSASKNKPAKVKKAKAPKASSSSAVRSVRNRRR